MKAWKRLGAVLIALLTLTAMLTGTALAAEPGASGISVQLNGEPVVMTDAAPEISDGRTFVPLRAVMEAMNAQVDYDGGTGTVEIHRGSTDLSMVLGQNRATVVENGQTRTITMDVTPYVKNGRTYVPVRFVAESFGCGVGWDQTTQTVIIVDADTLLGDATFDLMDNFAAYCAKQQTSDNMAISGALTLDVADKSGDYLPKPFSAKGSIDGVAGSKGLQMNWDLELSGLSDLLAGAASTPMEQLVMQQLVASLSDLKGEVRMDLDSGMVYVTLPAAITGGSADTWYSLDFSAYQAELLSSLNVTQLTQLKEAGVRDVLAAVIQSLPLDDSLTSYEVIDQVTSIYKAMLSDQAFTQSGNTYVAQMKLEDVVNLSVTLTKRGDDIVAADIKMDCDVADKEDRITITMTEHAAPDQVTVDVSMEMISGDISAKIDLDLTGAPTTKTPATTLPAGVQAVPMN